MEFHHPSACARRLIIRVLTRIAKLQMLKKQTISAKRLSLGSLARAINVVNFALKINKDAIVSGDHCCANNTMEEVESAKLEPTHFTTVQLVSLCSENPENILTFFK